MLERKDIGLLGLVILILALAWLISRTQFLPLIITYSAAFGIYFWLINQTFSGRVILWIGMGLRLGILFAYPLLSNDVFRFIWDGHLLVAGESPFALRPSEWMAMSKPPEGINNELHQLIYADNYTVYPPIHQLVFWLSAKLSTSIMGGVFILKSILILGEFLLLIILKNIKSISQRSPKLLFIYAFNPLIVLEISASGHFEGLLVLFLVISIFSLHQKKYNIAGVAFGISVATKLLPLMLLPIILMYLPRKKILSFLSWSIGINVLLWYPLWSMGSLAHLMDSVWLYFESFEFNASVFYLFQWLLPSYWRIGLMTNGLTILFILWIALRQKRMDFSQLVWNLTIIWSMYLLNGAIVHPWYLIPVIVLSGLANNRIGIIWSGLIFLSYSHYWGGGMQEHYWIIGVEYVLLLAFVGYDFFSQEDVINTAH